MGSGPILCPQALTLAQQGGAGQPDTRWESIDFSDSIPYSPFVAAPSVSGGRPQTFAMRSNAFTKPLLLSVGAVVLGALFVFVGRGFFDMSSGPYSQTLGFIHPPALIWGLVFALPLFLTTGFLVPRVTLYSLMISLGLAGTLAICLSFLLTQEFTPDGNLKLFSFRRLSELMPFFILPILLLLYRKLRRGTDEGEQDADRKPDHVPS
jgi:hypothetical protein